MIIIIIIKYVTALIWILETQHRYLAIKIQEAESVAISVFPSLKKQFTQNKSPLIWNLLEAPKPLFPVSRQHRCYKSWTFSFPDASCSCDSPGSPARHSGISACKSILPGLLATLPTWLRCEVRNNILRYCFLLFLVPSRRVRALRVSPS